MKVDIRKWKKEDASALAKLLNNEHILANLRDGLPFPYTEQDALEFIELMLNAPQNEIFAWAVTVDTALAGSAGIFRKENIHSRTAELGYYLGENFWGKGIMTQAVKKACGYIFENTDIMRIFAEPFSDNAGSCRVLEKAGFECEGLLKCNAVKNGEIKDMKMYALVKK